MRSLLVPLSLLLGCGDKGDTGGPAAGEPDLQASVTEVVLSEVPKSGWGQQTAAVELSNQGDGDLNIATIALASGEAWKLDKVYADLVLTPGGVQWVTLTFNPSAVGTWEDVLQVESDDPDTPLLEVSLSGEAVAGVLTAEADALDFGETTVTCTSTAELSFTNTGYDDLYVDQISLSGAPATVVLDTGEVEFPLLLAPDDSVTVGASFTPDGWKELAGKVVAKTSGGGESSTEVPLTGTVVTGEAHTESKEIPHYDVVDVLLALDRSSSMRTLGGALQYETDTLLEPLQAKGYDLHLAWTVEDTGCVNGDTPWLDSSTALEDADAIGAGMVDLYGLDHGVADEAFTMLYAALEASAAGGCAEGLVRTESSWHFVGISDDPEGSNAEWGEWAPLFTADHPAEEAFYVHGMGNDDAATCDRLEPYDGVLDAVDATGGSFHLLCDPAATVMGDLAAAIVERQEAVGEAGRSLPLEVQADGGAMTVTIDGAETTAWSYDWDTNTVILDAQPPGGSTYEVVYSDLLDCP